MKKNKMRRITQQLLLLFALVIVVTGCKEDNNTPEFEGADAYITAFRLNLENTVYKGAITDETIVVSLPVDVSLTEGVTATVELSENATLFPDPKEITNWEEEIRFVVTAYNQTKKTYLYTVEREVVHVSGDVVLATQEEVNAFAAKKVSVIEGSLTIGKAISDSEDDEINDLSGLSNLKRVKYNLTVYPTYTGEVLDGLANLETVGGLSLDVSNVKRIRWSKLTSIGLGLTVKGEQLEEINFPELVVVSKHFSITAPLLAAVAFPKLEVVFCGMAFGADLTSVTSISLPSLKQVEGILGIAGLNALKRLELPVLETVEDLSFSNLPELEEISFPALTRITKGLALAGCTRLIKLDFVSLEQVGSLNFSGSSTVMNPLLEQVDLSSLKRVNGDITWDLYYFGALTKLDFPGLLSVGNNLTLATGGNFGVAAIESLVFPVLKEIGGILDISANRNRTNSTLLTLDFSSLESALRIYIEYNKLLNSFRSFAKLIPNIDPADWGVYDNAYNPDYDDMVAGRYTPETTE